MSTIFQGGATNRVETGTASFPPGEISVQPLIALLLAAPSPGQLGSDQITPRRWKTASQASCGHPTGREHLGGALGLSATHYGELEPILGKDEVFKSESEHSDSFRQRDSFSQQLQTSIMIMCNIPGTLLLKPCDIIIVNPLKHVSHNERT